MDQLGRVEYDSGHVLKKDNCDLLRKTLDFEVAGRRGRGQPIMTWKSILIRLD